MLQNNRVIFNKNGTLTDLTLPMSDFHSNTSVIDWDTGTDYLYVGSDLPFNHRYFMVNVVNAQAASVSVDVWTGDGWVAAIDVIDGSVIGNACFAQSGIISWTPDPDLSSWSCDDTNDMTGSGLETLKIQGLYWARLKVSANLTATMALQYVGHKFSTDDDLYVEYPEFSVTNFKTAFKAGKTTWDEQSLAAAEYVIQELRTMNLARSADQILDWKLFQKASVHRTASVIFKAFGDDYSDNLVQSLRDFKDAIQIKYYNLDQNKDATLTEREKNATTTWLGR